MTNQPDLPSHASPIISPVPRPSAQYLQGWSEIDTPSQPSTPGVPNDLISPAFTPPLTPSTSIPGTPSGYPSSTAARHEPKSYPVDTDLEDGQVKKHPRLLQRLPNVECLVRARIPTTSGTEMFLHLYQNDSDNKEHLAIVFGNNIRSRSLDIERPGETEMDRMIRGAYVGRLRPGRTSSRRDDEEDLRRKVLKPADTLRRKRSGSALKNVTPAPDTIDTIPENQVLDTPSSSSSNPPTDEPALPPSATAASSPPPSSDTPASELKAPLVRIHSECYTGETAWSARCDCGEQLDEAARLMSTYSPTTNPQSEGVIVYLRQEGRGIGLASKLKAYNLQDLGNDTVEANLLLRHPADARTYGLATAILQDLGLGTDASERGVRLLTNNPDKVRAVEGPNKEVRVMERVAMVPIAWRTGGEKGVKGLEIEKYLETKIGRMGHMIHE